MTTKITPRDILLKRAKTSLGIKGKRRNNPTTTATFLNFNPKGRRGKDIAEGTTAFKNAVDNEILRRFSSAEILYSQNITIKTRRRYKDRKTPLHIVRTLPFLPHQVSNTHESIRGELTGLMTDYIQDELEEWDNDSPYEYERDENGAIIYETVISTPIRQSGSLMVKTKSGRQRTVPVNMRRIFMMKSGAFKLDECYVENDKWDLKQDTCVFDYIYHKYRNGDRLKKLLAGTREEVYNTLNILFNNWAENFDKLDDDTTEEYDAINNGVCIDHLIIFCETYRIPLYAYDKQYKNIIRHQPPRDNKSKNPAFIFVISNSHFYPIEDIHHRASLVSKTRNENNDNIIDWVSEETDDKIFGEKNGTEKPLPIFATDEIIGNEMLFKTIMETNTLPSKLRLDGSTVKSFIYNDQKYITNMRTELDDVIQRWCEYKDIQYWGQSVLSVLKSLLDEKYGENYSFPELTSKLNPYVYDNITQDGVKYRQHYGATENLERLIGVMPTTTHIVEKEIETPFKNIFTGETLTKKRKIKISVADPPETILDCKIRLGDIACYDINKAYTSVMYKPRDNFIVYDVDDIIEPFQPVGMILPLKTGLYYVETYDNKLLHQSNWYSNKIIDLARSENIEMKITHQLIPKNNNINRSCVDKTFLKIFMDWVMEDMKNVEGGNMLYKNIFNSMYGKMGKTKNINRNCNCDTNIEEVWRCFLKCDPPETEEDKKHYFYNDKFKDTYNRLKKDDRIICDDISYDKENPLYIFGFEKKENKLDIQLPVHIQILDWSNMLLFELQKKVGGKCLFRKTDMVMMEYSPSNRPKKELYEEGWGGFKKDKGDVNLTSMMKKDRHINKPDWEVVWNINYEYFDSDDADRIIELANEKGGLLISGRAGTGKTHIIKNNKYMNDDNTVKMSFTNKASRNCGGSTIHKTLKLNTDLKTQKKVLEKFRYKDYVVIDEIGMVNQDLLNLLHILKKVNHKLKFILCGDFRQLPPIEEHRIEESDIFNHPIVMYLAHSQKMELTVRKRYDKDLWDYLERGYEDGDWSGLPTKIVEPIDLTIDRAICFYNKTRVRINNWAMEHLKPDDALWLEYIRDEENKKIIDIKKDRASSVWLYPTLPIMSITNNKELGLINSDEYLITDVYESSFIAVQDGDDFETIEIPFIDFHKLFVANYIATTHKSQGATYYNNILLFDSKRMEQDRRIKYTAVSRGTALDKIYNADV